MKSHSLSSLLAHIWMENHSKFCSPQNISQKNQHYSDMFFSEVLLCLYLADPATLLASNIVPGTLFSSESNLFIHLL